MTKITFAQKEFSEKRETLLSNCTDVSIDTENIFVPLYKCGKALPSVWDCPIPYVLGSNLTKKDVRNIFSAFEILKIETKWRFTLRINQTDYIYFTRADRCFSEQWRFADKGRHFVGVNPNCGVLGVARELAHAIGVWATKCRQMDGEKMFFDFDKKTSKAQPNRMGKNYRNHRKVSRTPRRPFEKERLDGEIKLAGKYGLKNKREIWRIQKKVAHIRKAARVLLTLEQDDSKRLFEGEALMRRLKKMKVLSPDSRLDDVLNLKVEDFLDRSLQTIVYKSAMAKSPHHSRVLIRQGHISVRNQIVNVPSFAVTEESERHINFAENSFLVNENKIGRTKRKNLKNKKAKGENVEGDL